MHIAWFEEIGEQSRERFGGKGLSLVKLLAAGFPVPDGFVVTPDGVEELRRQGESAGEVLTAAISAWSALAPGGGPVAVRSSAVDEDGETASFSGQYETVLNVGSREALVEAIERCVSSAGSQAVARYRKERGLTEAGGGMAIVVQRMVQARFAGVVFTVDPVSGTDDRIVIEYVTGTAEGLMAGERAGTRVVLGRPGLEVLDGSEGELEMEGVLDVARLALDVEEFYGAPQDIEFAIDDERVWVLQSRPITAKGGSAEGWVSEFDSEVDDETEWTSANIQEVLPGLLTPLSMSIYGDSAREGYNVGFQKLGVLGKDDWQPFMATFYNRAFLNLTATRMIADRAPGSTGDDIEREYLAGGAQTRGEREPLRRRAKFMVRSFVPMTRLLFTLRGTAERMDRRTRALEQRMRSMDADSMSGEELVQATERALAHGGSIFGTHLQVSGVALVGMKTVTRLVRPILGDETEGRVPVLFSGMRNVESARISLDLWNLAVVARNAGIEDRVRADDFAPGAPELPDGWRAAWRTFIADHGHRGINEMEASTRSWRIDPGPALQVVRSYLDLDEERSPAATLSRQERERRRLTAQLARRMNPVKRRLFRKALEEAQGWVALRERTKSVIVRAARISDHFLPAMQQRLLRAGVIDDAEDIFFLTRDEIREALISDAPAGMQETITRRRREYERNRYVRLPERFRGHPVPLPPEEPTGDGALLHGTPVSPGIATGRARVVLDPAKDGGIEPGEILVAPVTDAGWTPLFALASALVVDLGSTLSHRSTVAREFGLPAVVNVHNGTRVIQTGDLVTVNGTTGTVTVTKADDED